MGPAVKPSVPRMPAGSYKPSKAKQLAKVFSRLQQLLLSEWQTIRGANLGVKSGTSILEDVLLLQLNQLATHLHTLAVSDQEAASRLVELAGKLSEQHFQQLQVLLDVLGHEELSDFLALLVRQEEGRHTCSSKGYSAAAATAAASLVSRSGSGTLSSSQHRVASSVGGKQLLGSDSGSAAGQGWQRRNRAAAGVAFDVEGLDSLQDSSIRRRSSMGSSSCPDLKGLRFACLLPPGHLLTKTAEQLQRQQEFETALQASKAAVAAAAAAARAQQHAPAVPMLQLPGRHVPRYGDASVCRPGSGNSCSSYTRSAAGGPTSPFRWAGDDDCRSNLGFSPTGFRSLQLDAGGLLAEPSSMPDPLSSGFRAPSRNVEQIWKEGRKATTEAVLGAAHMQLHEGPFGVLMLQPPLVLQPRVVQQQQQAVPVLDTAAAAAGVRPNSARSRRGSVTSRPCSAAAAGTGRRGTRASASGFQANAADGVTLSGGPLAAFGSTIAGAAAGISSIAGNGNTTAVAAAAGGAGSGQLGRQGSTVDSYSSRLSTWAASPAAATAASTSRRVFSAATGNTSSAESPCSMGSAAVAATPFSGGMESRQQALGAGTARRMAFAGPRAAGVNLLDPAGSSTVEAATGAAAASAKGGVAVSALQLSRLGSMHAPGAAAAAAAATTARPDSAGSSSRSRPESAASTSRLAVSARAGGAPQLVGFPAYQ
uniref:Uncharacterized protein n=1 Tax=Tetradesmus obliquus TaxID=3088 RepID=A0A383W4I5_TETOB|eukprot:jgi/Sobl393_1/10149/SZX79485.1